MTDVCLIREQVTRSQPKQAGGGVRWFATPQALHGETTRVSSLLGAGKHRRIGHVNRAEISIDYSPLISSSFVPSTIHC